MKLDYLIDTNIFISLFNNELDEPIPGGDIGYSIITEIEILSFRGLSTGEEQPYRKIYKRLTEKNISCKMEIRERSLAIKS